VPGTPEIGDLLGYGISAVQVTSRGWYDLVIGAPGETTGKPGSGLMLLIPGSASGLTGTGSEEWTAGSAGVNGAECTGCSFGAATGGSSSTSLND
jgi:hypothetical protein